MALLDHLIQVLSSLSASQAIGLAAMVVEAILRLVKSDKPLSLLLLAAVLLHKAAQVLELVASILDKILPQRVSAPADAPKIGA